MLSNRQVFLNHLAQTTSNPLMIEIDWAEGVFMYGPEGKKYIDLISGIGVSNVGHRHPKVLEAIKDQLDKYLHLMVYGEFVQTPQLKLAQALKATLPDSIDNFYFVNSGTEAIEGALKLAKRHTGRSELISCENAYHGSSHGALSISGSEFFKRSYRPLLPDVKHISFGKLADLAQISEKTACVVMETVQGEAGVRFADENYFKALSKKCADTGALLVLDEIQSGFGRTGTFWAFEQYGIIPDVVVAAKGMGGGMPIGAFMSSKKIMECLTENPLLGHITTFGGHPVSCAASIATIEIIYEEKLLSKVSEKSELFLSLIKHEKIVSARSKGLMIAIEFESFAFLKKVIDIAIEMGVLTDWFLYCDNSMRIAPPLTIREEEIRLACDIVVKAIDKASK